MSITVSIAVDSPEEARRAYELLSSLKTQEPEAEKETAPTRKKTTRKRTKKVGTKSTVVVDEPADETLDDVMPLDVFKDKVMEYFAALGKGPVQEMLDQVGAKSASKVPEDRRQEALDFLDARMTKQEDADSDDFLE